MAFQIEQVETFCLESLELPFG